MSGLQYTGNLKLGQPMNMASFEAQTANPFIEPFILSGGALVPALATCIKISLLRLKMGPLNEPFLLDRHVGFRIIEVFSSLAAD